MHDEGFISSGPGGPRGVEPPYGRGTRSTLRLGPASADRLAASEQILLLPARIGFHRLVIEASRVVEVVPGGAWTGALDPERPVVNADLYRELGVLAPEDRETILARADGKLGRGPGRYVAFSVDRAERLVKLPLECCSPLPEIARERITVDFIAGVVRFQFPDDGMGFLLDPMRIADSAGTTSEEVP